MAQALVASGSDLAIVDFNGKYREWLSFEPNRFHYLKSGSLIKNFQKAKQRSQRKNSSISFIKRIQE